MKQTFKTKNPWNAIEFPKEYEKNNKPSMTVPDQTMSLKTLLERYARGYPITGQEPVYHTDPDTGEAMDLPDLRKMDLSEIAALKETIQNQINDQQAELFAQQKEKDRITMEENQKLIFKKWKDEESKNQTTDEAAPNPNKNKKPGS